MKNQFLDYWFHEGFLPIAGTIFLICWIGWIINAVRWLNGYNSVNIFWAPGQNFWGFGIPLIPALMSIVIWGALPFFLPIGAGLLIIGRCINLYESIEAKIHRKREENVQKRKQS